MIWGEGTNLEAAEASEDIRDQEELGCTMIKHREESLA